MASYIALLRKDAGSDYGVEFPDFPGCVTAGSSLEEARIMAAEALDLHIAGMIEDGDTLPEPSRLDGIMSRAANADAVAFLVDVAARPARSLRINITLPADLIEAIDRAAPNRSRFLAEAAAQRLRAEAAN